MWNFSRDRNSRLPKVWVGQEGKVVYDGTVRHC